MRNRSRTTALPERAKTLPGRGWLVALVLTAAAYPAAAQEAEPPAKLLEVTSTSPEAAELFRAGLADAMNNIPLRMSEQMEQALTLDPELGLARVVSARYALDMPRDERQAELRRGMASLAASDASTGEWLMALGFRQMLQGDGETSRRIFATLSDLYPDDPTPAYLHALITQGVEGMNQAIVEFESLTKTFPDFAPAYNMLAYGLWQGGDRAGGVKAIETYLKLLPEHPNANDSYAEIMQWSGRYDEAIQYYNRANEIYPIWAWSAGLADTYQLMGEGAQAREHLAVAIETAPTNGLRIAQQFAVGNSFLLDGDIETALERYDAAAREAEAAEMSGRAGWTYAAMAVADGLLGDGRSVESALQKAAEAIGAEAPAYQLAAALAWAASGDSERAVAALDGLDDETVAHTTRALLHMHQDEMLEAETELAQADQDSDLVRALLGTCYKEAGRTAEAHALRDDVLARRDVALTDMQGVIARALAARI